MLDKIIERVNRLKNKDYSQSIEKVIEQAIILPVLSDLGWDRDDTEEVYPQFQVDNRKVDYSLRIASKNKVFIEVKRTNEELEKHQNQLLDYSYRSGISLAVLTNGIDWWFFLPLLGVDWTQRKFYSINLRKQPESEVAERFIDFLSKPNVESDTAIRTAQKFHDGNIKSKTVSETLPIIWKEIIKGHSESLVEILMEETEKKCGFLPKREDVYHFLDKIKSEQNEPFVKEQYIVTDGSKDGNIEDINTEIGAQTILKVTIDGKVMNKVRINGSFPLVIRKESVQNYPRKNTYKRISNSDFFIFSNNNTENKKKYIESIAKQLGYRVQVVTIEK
jgi:hypothetical protein